MMLKTNIQWRSATKPKTGSLTAWMFLKKLNIELPYDPAIPLLGIYLDKTFIEKGTCTPIFMAVLVTISQ